MEKMKEMREDARKGQDSNSGAVEGSNNLQNWGTLDLVPNDQGEKRPSRGGLGATQVEDETIGCLNLREMSGELSQGLQNSLNALDLEGRKSGVNSNKTRGLKVDPSKHKKIIYKKSKIIRNKCTDIPGMSPENLRKLAHPKLEISTVHIISLRK